MEVSKCQALINCAKASSKVLNIIALIKKKHPWILLRYL